MHRRRRPFLTWILLAIFAASTAVAELPCPSDCCDAEDQSTEADATSEAAPPSDHCAEMMGAAAQASAAPALPTDSGTECGCHEISASEGSDDAPASVGSTTRVAPSAPALPVMNAPSIGVQHHGRIASDAPAGPTRAPPLFLLNASFLN